MMARYIFAGLLFWGGLIWVLGSEVRPSSPPRIETLLFRQTLLRDACKYLADTSGFKIELSDSVGKIDDLAVAYRADGKPLDEILKEICEFLKTSRNVSLISIRVPNENRFRIILDSEVADKWVGKE